MRCAPACRTERALPDCPEPRGRELGGTVAGEQEPTNRAEELFAELIALPAAERPGFLDRACAGDAPLRERVVALVAGYEEAARLLPAPLVTRGEVTPSEKPGDRIGRYHLVETLGEGGCGAVYLAEQEEPVRRQVALKVIKLGMDTREVIARFEVERQALALMDHPNIARVFDGGATATGRPYFVMELVRGLPLTRYCDEHELATADRLGLFVQVCHAVQHAHQKGIIHRDLKPSNILVTEQDGRPVPKVIDFGIAKATGGRLADGTVFTAWQQFVGTPVYMSPEQAEMRSPDIDTRSDIYSLGVLLYELLTGRTPFDAGALHAAGINEIRRRICETEPLRPSARLRTLQGEALHALAQQRRTEPLQLIRSVRGDLDWIVMKALEKERTRRYSTANALAADITDCLANRPVTARPPSGAYRFQKFAMRHRWGLAAGVAVVLALAVGMVVALVALQRERAARQSAVEARNTAERLLTFLHTDLGEQLNEIGQTALLGQLTEQVLAYYEQLPPALRNRETQAARALALTGINTDLMRLSSLTLPTRPGGLSPDERVAIAQRMMMELEANGELSPVMRIAAANVGWTAAICQSSKLQWSAALDSFARAENVLRPALSDPQLGSWAGRFLTQLVWAKAVLLSTPAVGRASAAIAEFERALALAKDPERNPSRGRPQLALGLLELQFSDRLAGLDPSRRDEARRLHGQARARLRQLLEIEPPSLLNARNALGAADVEAAAHARQTWRFKVQAAALADARELLAPLGSAGAANLAISWGDVFRGKFSSDWQQGDFPAAQKSLEESVRLFAGPRLGPQSRSMLVTQQILQARLQAAVGHDQEVGPALAAAEATRQRFCNELPALSDLARKKYWAYDEGNRREVEFHRLNWSAMRASAEKVLALAAQTNFPAADVLANVDVIEAARRHLVISAFEMGDYAAARSALEAWAPRMPPLPADAEIQDRFERLGTALTRIHVLARAGEAGTAREELAALWDEVEAVFAAGPEFLFNRVQTARALAIRAEITETAVETRVRWLERAAGYLRPAAAANRLTRYEREVTLAAVETQLSALGAGRNE